LAQAILAQAWIRFLVFSATIQPWLSSPLLSRGLVLSKRRMFKLLCCMASETADKTTELWAHAHEKAKEVANDFTQRQLKDALVGESETVQEAPLTLVTVVDVTMTDGVSAKSLTCFSIKGLQCRARVKILRTPVQSLECDLVVDLEKAAGVGEVVAKVVAVTSSHEAISEVMAIEVLQRHVETAISQRLSRQIAEWQKNAFSLENARARGGELASAGMKKGAKLAVTAKEKQVEMARGKGEELVAAGLVKGGELAQAAAAKVGGLVEAAKMKAES